MAVGPPPFSASRRRPRSQFSSRRRPLISLSILTGAGELSVGKWRSRRSVEDPLLVSKGSRGRTSWINNEGFFVRELGPGDQLDQSPSLDGHKIQTTSYSQVRSFGSAGTVAAKAPSIGYMTAERRHFHQTICSQSARYTTAAAMTRPTLPRRQKALGLSRSGNARSLGR